MKQTALVAGRQAAEDRILTAEPAAAWQTLTQPSLLLGFPPDSFTKPQINYALNFRIVIKITNHDTSILEHY